MHMQKANGWHQLSTLSMQGYIAPILGMHRRLLMSIIATYLESDW